MTRDAFHLWKSRRTAEDHLSEHISNAMGSRTFFILGTLLVAYWMGTGLGGRDGSPYQFLAVVGTLYGVFQNTVIIRTQSRFEDQMRAVSEVNHQIALKQEADLAALVRPTPSEAIYG
jgi:uncharacterized membrane protein